MGEQLKGQRSTCIEGLLHDPLKLALSTLISSTASTKTGFASDKQKKTNTPEKLLGGVAGKEGALTFAHLHQAAPAHRPPSPQELSALRPRSGAGDICQTPATRAPVTTSGGMTPSRGHCPPELGADSGSPGKGYGKGVFLAQLLGRRALNQPEGQEGQPWGRGRDIPRDTCYGFGTAFGGLRLPPRSLRDAKSDRAA